ncbi:MAG TPA: phospholipase [Phycisphaerales bacterium]|nr:phospholipase [Phycisphaerales bacterium]
MAHKMREAVFCFVWVVCSIGTNLCNGNNQMYKDKFEVGIFTCSNTVKMNYRFLKPITVDLNEKYPLVLFLHGSGERGTDNEKQLNLGVWKFACEDMQTRYPCFVIAPQCPQECKWVDVDWEADWHSMPENPSKYMKAVLELVDNMMTQYPIDKQRIYVTGVSMGGFGTWDLIQRRPKFFAAAVPLCGGGDMNCAPDLKDVPIWAFHNKGDDSVKSKRSRDMVEAIKRAGGHPIYTEYNVNNHNCWDAAYDDRDMYKWMFSQFRELVKE